MEVLNRCKPAVTSKELMQLTGLSYRRVDYWTTTGALNPHTDGVGAGYNRYFDHVAVRTGLVLAMASNSNSNRSLALMVARAQGFQQAIRNWDINHIFVGMDSERKEYVVLERGKGFHQCSIHVPFPYRAQVVTAIQSLGSES